MALLFSLLIITGCQPSQRKIDMTAPVAKKIDKELTIHGHTRMDPYYWLREREDPEVIAYLEAENAYTETMMKDTREFENRLYKEIVGRIKQDDQSVPYLDNGYYYYTRFEKGGEYPLVCRKKGSLEAEEEIMLNVPEMAKGHAYFQIGGYAVSPDNKMMVYGVDTVGRRKYTLYFKHLESGEIHEDAIPATDGNACWANDNRTVFYTQRDEETLRNHKVFRHVLGSRTDQDVLVHHEDDETFSTFVYKTKSDKYIMIGSGSILSDEYRFLDADQPGGEFIILQERERELEYSVGHFRDRFYIRTNLDAKNFRLMETPVDATSKENWKEIIPHRENVLLTDLELFNDYMVVSERKEGLLYIRIIEWESGQEHYLDFGEEVYVARIAINTQFDTKLLRYAYSSLTTPNSTFDYHMESRGKTLLKQQEVIGDFDPANYESRRIYATAKDGSKIPMSMVYRKGMQQDGKNHLLLYGYGSYGYTREPAFNSTRLSLLDRGFIFVIAHVRGGQIYGRQWYEDGKMFNKMNTFTDFNACAEQLIADHYTGPDHLYAMGGSAGGLLMGVIINLQPELYHGIIASVPFVDVVTTMLDDDIPLTTGEFDEWGNPDNRDSYEYMLSYSPYDNVEARKYPNLLVTTGLHDSQVQYWEPAKWVAKLRDMKTDDNLLLLKTNMDAGHGGASGRFEYLKEVAFEYTFLLKLAGKT
ncbi:MAG: protease 2 [Bacteroides sp. SM23_62]|nr:MAG: protease 2 [Bacteroides sp. SM23_62]